MIHTIAPSVTSVKLGKRDARIGALGDTVRLKANVAWSGHGTMPAAWTSLDPAVARVDTQGLVTAVGAGTARIVATADAYADTGRVTVQQVPASVAISHAATTVNAIGDTLRLGATVFDANGHAIPGIAFTWTSLSPKIATVDPLGALVSRGVGLVLVTAAAAGHLDTASINVRQVPAAISITPTSLATSVGKSDKLIASAADSNGITIPAAGFIWRSSDTRVATVDGAGTVTGRAPGAVTVVLSLGGVSTVVPVRVDAAPVAVITLSTSSASLVEGGTLSLDARLRDAAGNALNDRAVAWSSSRPAVATVGADDVVRGLTTGTATITASVEGKSATTSITVVAPSIASLSVTPGTASAVVGGSVTWVATPRDALGNALPGFTVSWASQNPAVASVSKAGVVTALAAGTTIVSATSEGKTGSATRTITAPLPPTPAPVASITLSPNPVSLPVASTALLSAVIKDAEGKALTGRALVWSSSKPTVATVSSTGVVTAVAPGNATITATSEGKSGTSTVTVTAPPPEPVATVTLSPTSLALDPGQSRAISAVIKDASGNLLSGRILTWTSSNASVAKVSSDGVVTAVAAGAATITATSEGKSGVVGVSVKTNATSATVLFADDFESYTPGQSIAGKGSNGFAWAGSRPVSAAHSFSGRTSLEFRYKGTPLGGDATSEQRFVLAPSAASAPREVWIEYMLRMPDNFAHRYDSPANNKFLALWAEKYSTVGDLSAIVEYERTRSSPTSSAKMLSMSDDYGAGKLIRKQPGAFQTDDFLNPSMAGKWVQVRLHAKAASGPGQTDGVLEGWINGRLVFRSNDWVFWYTNGNNYFRHGYLMGWANSGFDEDTTFYIDDFRVYASNPRW